MASSENGEYSLNTINEVHTNTQDNAQAEWPRWIPGEVTTSTSTVEYQEGYWAIGWPSSVNEERVMQDDLILKYNFQESGPWPVPPVPTCNTIYFSSEYEATHEAWWAILCPSSLSDVPNWSLVTPVSCCETCDHRNLVVYNDELCYEQHVIAVPEDENYCVLCWEYCAQWGSWTSVESEPIEVSNWLQLRAELYR